jgi:uncharacterized protein YlzI (FlbEa/FlbD family)
MIIQLTQSNQDRLWVNANQIGYYETVHHAQAHTQIKLTSGDQLLVMEGPDEVTQKIVAARF